MKTPEEWHDEWTRRCREKFPAMNDVTVEAVFEFYRDIQREAAREGFKNGVEAMRAACCDFVEMVKVWPASSLTRKGKACGGRARETAIPGKFSRYS